jgi:peptidyl-prolyl cis-trans isomerase D
MPDLFRGRGKLVLIVLAIVLGIVLVGVLLVSLSMLMYLVPSYNPGTSGAGSIVAEVAGHYINTSDVKQLIEQTLKGRQLPPEVLPQYIPKLVDAMIADRALEYQAGKLGIRVTDRDVAAATRELLPESFPDGRFAGKEAYAALLAERNMTISQFETEVRRMILIHRLKDPAIEGPFVSEPEIQRAYQERNEKIKLQFVKLVADRYRKELEPGMGEMKAYFALHSLDFQFPPQRSLAILCLDPATLEQSLAPTEGDLQAFYQQNTQGKPASEEHGIKAQAGDILRQLKSGARFADLVEKYSEDPGSQANAPGREPGLGPGEYWVERNHQMVPEFENAAFTLKPGQSDVIKTAFGYHVFQVVERQDARMRPFEEVKADLARQWKTQRASMIEQAAAAKAEAELRADPTHPEKVAAGLNMQLVRVNNYTAGQPVPEIGINPEFQSSVENLKLNEVSPPVALPNNRLALAVVSAVIPARQKTFEEAEPELRGRMLEARLAAALTRHAQELYDKARAMNGDLAAAAGSMGLAAMTSEEFSRSGILKDLDNATYFKDGFTLPDGAVFGPIALASGAVVPKVIAHIPADQSGLAAQRDSIRDELFESRVVADLERKGTIKRHKDAIDRLVAAYAVKE